MAHGVYLQYALGAHGSYVHAGSQNSCLISILTRFALQVATQVHMGLQTVRMHEQARRCSQLVLTCYKTCWPRPVRSLFR